MAILGFSIDSIGQSGQEPKFIYINTNNTVAEVTAAGFLNGIVSDGAFLSETNMAVVSTRATPNAKSAQVNLFDVSFSGGNWSLSANATPLALADGKIFVGNASGTATAVTMSGAATLANTGALTIAANAITTAKILDANVTLAKLASGITPSHVVKFGGTHTTVGGAAAEAITVTGAAATDLPFVQVLNDGTNNVTVLAAAVTTNTLTVTFSANPGADAIIVYQLLRVAA